MDQCELQKQICSAPGANFCVMFETTLLQEKIDSSARDLQWQSTRKSDLRSLLESYESTLSESADLTGTPRDPFVSRGLPKSVPVSSLSLPSQDQKQEVSSTQVAPTTTCGV